LDIVHNWQDHPAATRGAVMAIGNFDGVHRGHQALLKRACEIAEERDAKAGAIVFEPHPRTFFQPDRPFFELTPLPRKLRLMELFSLDIAAVVRFDAALASLTAEQFIEQVLVDGLQIAHAVAGYNFFFGKGRGGNPTLLQDLGTQAGIGVDIVEAVGGAGEVFSSTRARETLAEGDPRGAAEVLGYWWRVVGEVTGGAGRGRADRQHRAGRRQDGCLQLRFPGLADASQRLDGRGSGPRLRRGGSARLHRASQRRDDPV